MRNSLGFAMVFLFSAAFSQENYAQWTHYKTVTVNTTSSGANVTATVANFPLLVRLTSANADVFTQSLSGGADIRFSDSTGTTHYKYEKERWNANGQVAEFWVLAPNVAGNANTTLRMYWGKSGVADSSRSAAVFDTANGFTAVYHMNEALGIGPKDATLNGLDFTARATVPATLGQIDSARTYAGGTGGTPDSINRNDKFNVTNSSFSISAWVIRPAANSSQYEGIFSNWRYSAGNYRSYILEEKSNGSYAVQVSSGGVADDKIPQTTATFSNAAWHHVVATMSVANGIKIYVDGASQALTGDAAAVAPFVNTDPAARPLIGAMERANTQPFVGSIDQIEVSINTERSADWVKLSYETQKTGSTAVAFGTTVSLIPPGAPTGVSGVAGNTQVAVTWSAPSSDGGSPITGYTATSSPDGKTCTTTGTLTCSVIGLTNNTAYTFTVTATNAAGTSVASTASSAVTPIAPAGVPGSPTGATAVAGNAQATISWTAPTSIGGSAITAYTVTSNPDGKTCTTTGAVTCVVTGLINGTAYTFTVTATNTSGSSAPSSPSTAVTPIAPPGAPTGVTGLAGNAQVTVSWAAPTSTGGSAITGYTATSNPGAKTCTTTGTLSCIVTGLTNNTGYTFTVTAANAAGTGSVSAVSATVTPLPPPTAPGAPTTVTGIGSSGQVTISWAAPTSTGGSAITGYTVTVVQDTTYHCYTTGALTCTVLGLINSVSYTFTVTATNAIGTSAASAPSSPVTSLLSFSKDMGMHLTGSSLRLNLPEFTGTASVSMVDLWGRVVWSKTVNAGVRTVAWENRSAFGVYILRLVVQDSNHKPRLAAESKILLTP